MNFTVQVWFDRFGRRYCRAFRFRHDQLPNLHDALGRAVADPRDPLTGPAAALLFDVACASVRDAYNATAPNPPGIDHG